jgi:hypothetical protein
VLVLITIATTVLFLRINRPATPAPAVDRAIGFRGAWRPEHWFSLIVLIFATAVCVTSLGYEPMARFVPMSTSGVVVALMLFQLVLRRGRTTEHILDIGLRSMEFPAARRNALVIFMGVVLYMVFSLIIGLMYASVLFAALAPLIMMKGRAALLTSAVGVVLISLMSMGLLDYYMGVFWPEPYISSWIKGTW